MSMFANRFASALVVTATLSLGMLGSAASAADLKLKAPPPPAAVPLDIHAFAEVTFLNDYITPRGLLVTNTGLTTQILTGITMDLYKDKMGFVNGISVYGAVWSDLWSDQHDVHVGSWNEFDWWLGMTVTFAQNWTFGAQYIELIPPAADLATSFPAIEKNMEFSLSYDDTSWGWLISFHPYVKLWYALSGPSTVVLGKMGGTYDVEIGIVPTLDTQKYTGVPLVLTAPTWVTVGPSSYWNRNDGTTNACGPLSSSPCALGNAGVFTTGLQGKLALDAVVPKRLGKWYVKAGGRYYHIINEALLAAQEFTGAAGGAAGVLGTFPNAHRDVFVGFAGIGFGF
jgi:hypothetical protein